MAIYCFKYVSNILSSGLILDNIGIGAITCKNKSLKLRKATSIAIENNKKIIIIATTILKITLTSISP